jgi:hypothetical protein
MVRGSSSLLGRTRKALHRGAFLVLEASDAMPLTVRIKTLMAIQSIPAFLSVGLVAARAVNIVNT